MADTPGKPITSRGSYLTPIKPTKYETLTPADTDPVTLAEVKNHLKVDTDADDALITALIKTATEDAETFQRRAYVQRTLSIFIDEIPRTGQEIILPVLPVMKPTGEVEDTVTAPVITIKQDDEELSIDASQFDVDYLDGKIKLNASWAPVYDQTKLPYYNALTITVTAGYGAAEAVPATVKQAILLIIGHYYENRSNTSTGKEVKTIPQGAERLLWQNRNF